ncbi:MULTISPECIES: dihydroxyacetone kinase subunit DhaL [Clostridium]|uniref:dihydroxyacetone kinase subunit DhaL n=1 Tax=Clostridium TaxID=1485 RepID=UPI00069E1B8C|nr:MULTISPECIES: dihydroxyacetone kinase subunit DhaL [Clostridium]KOF56022.1 glycerol kinase [Clostridium sp. DMHC 10]MCD2345492.1 dihydroxyacetone kinase subunit L [Clostridium guangxiense]
MNKEFLKKILGEITKVMNEEKEYLIELDGAMGDGDLGLTMSTGFKTMYDEVNNVDSDDIGTVMMKLGMKMNSTVPSTMGTLISICFLKAAKEAKGKAEVDLLTASKMGRAAVNGVMERGKAKVGQKTMLDALDPAVRALEKAAEENQAAKAAFEKAYEAAKQGVENTKQIKSVHGRAAYYGEKSLGRPDSGAVAVMFIFKGIAQSF